MVFPARMVLPDIERGTSINVELTVYGPDGVLVDFSDPDLTARLEVISTDGTTITPIPAYGGDQGRVDFPLSAANTNALVGRNIEIALYVIDAGESTDERYGEGVTQAYG